MIKTLTHEYPSESIPQELSNEYQHDRVLIVSKNVLVLVLWIEVASALEGLKHHARVHSTRTYTVLLCYYLDCRAYPGKHPPR